ncbi:M56 family metallopeptidase [Clostridiales bacterium COT073_COT-073]|nr:M56 family metallopeptidase [Clostridiales bacterium COT073_COT-073]
MTLLQMSMSAAVLIIIITVLRAVSIHKLPKKTFLFLWGLVFFRLLLPISIPSVFSIYSWIPQNKPYVSESANHLPRFSVTSDMVGNSIATNVGTQGFFGGSTSLWTVLWLIGFSLCILYFITAYRRGMKKFKNALPLETAFIKEWKEKHPLKRTLSIQSSDQVSTPLSYGMFKPVILLPRNLDFENTEALNYILTHEYVHIRHFDILTKMLMILALSIHWFNPMVWVMYLLLNRDIELICDETVINLFGEKNKSSYAHILIDMEIQKAGLMPLCNNFSKNATQERIGAIMKMKKMTIFSLVLAGLLVVGVTMAFATSAQTKDGRSLAEQDRMNGTHISYENSSILSYKDPKDGKNYVKFTDDGKTYQTMLEEDYEKKFPDSVIEWWTYDEYKAWLENKKVELSELIGEKIGTNSEGDIILTQKLANEIISDYEKILEEIKSGIKVSKTIDGNPDSDTITVMNPLDMEMGKSNPSLTLYIQLENGEEKHFGPYETTEELLKVVKLFCEEQIKNGNMKQSEYDEILSKYSSASENPNGAVNDIGVLPSENQGQTEKALLTGGEDATSYEEQATEQRTALTPDELEKLYSAYKPFGLTYDKKQDCFYYKGKIVGTFIDIMQTNGESLSSGKFEGTLRQIENPKGEGEIVISTIRDYDKKDEFGNGTLIGIKEGY